MQVLNAIWTYWQENWALYIGLGITINGSLVSAGYHVPAYIGIVLTSIAGLHTINTGGKALMAYRAAKAIKKVKLAKKG